LLAFANGDQNILMALNQFENSRVCEGMLRTEHPASPGSNSTATEDEISNMIAEGGPAPQETTAKAVGVLEQSGRTKSPSGTKRKVRSIGAAAR